MTDTPGFLAIVGVRSESRDLPGASAAADLPMVRLTGGPNAPRATILRSAGTALLVFGHCLASCEQMNRDWRRFGAVADGEPDIGHEVALRWPGAYCLLFSRPGSLSAYTDPAGQFPVYFSCHRATVALASDPRLLAALHRRPLDPVTAALRITCPEVSPLWAERTPFDGVARLPGGTRLWTDGRQKSVLPYVRQWPDADADPSECADQIGAALTEAVRLRCAKTNALTSDFSGGYDSTSVALLAAAHQTAPLSAAVYHQPLAPASDVAHAERCAAADRRIRLTQLTGAEETLPYGAWPWFVGSEPWPGMVCWRRTALRLDFAVAHGARIHLTGEGGDALLAPSPAVLGDLWKARKLRALIQQSASLSRRWDVSPLEVAVRAVSLGRSKPARALGDLSALMAASARINRPVAASRLSVPRHEQVTAAVSWWSVAPEAVNWLTAEMARTLTELTADPAAAARVPADATPGTIAAATAVRNSADAQRYVRELGHTYGVEVHAPFLDTSVYLAATRVLPRQLAAPGAYKPLLRQALSGRVSPSVFERSDKGDYSAEDHHGARRAHLAMDRLLHDSRLAQLGVIEPARVRESLVRMRAGIAVPTGPLNHLFATEAWLRARDDPPGDS